MSKSFELKGLRERRAKVRAELLKLGETLRREDRQMNTEERSRFDRLKAEFVAAGAGIQARESELAQIEATLGAAPTYSHAVRGGRNTPTAEERSLSLQGWMRSQCGLPLKRAHREAMRACRVSATDKYFTVGGAEKRDQSTSSTAGGETIPQFVGDSIVTSLKMFGGPRAVATVKTAPTGAVVVWPTVNDTAQTGELLGENTGAAEQDVTFSSVSVDPVKYSSKLVQVSNELMQDSAFNLEMEIGKLLGTRIGRKQGVDFTTGAGTGGVPQGVVVGASTGITAASATAIVGTEIVRLAHAVDPAYRSAPGNVGYMMHDSILAALAILVDSEGRPLFRANFGEGKPDTLYGYPVFTNQHMQSSIATATVTVLFGNFTAGYCVQDVAPGLRLRRLDERYAEADQTAFVGFLRSDARYLDTAAVKKLTQA